MNPEAYSETYQTSQMDVFAKVVNDFNVSEIPVAWKNSLCNKILRDLLKKFQDWRSMCSKIAYLQITEVRTNFRAFISLCANFTKWSNTLKLHSANCQRFVWVCLTILWNWHLKGYCKFHLGFAIALKHQLTWTWKFTEVTFIILINNNPK